MWLNVCGAKNVWNFSKVSTKSLHHILVVYKSVIKNNIQFPKNVIFLAQGLTHKLKIHSDYDKSSQIGSTFKPSQSDRECDEGAALTVSTKFDQKNAYYVDFHGLNQKSKDLDSYIKNKQF